MTHHDVSSQKGSRLEVLVTLTTGQWNRITLLFVVLCYVTVVGVFVGKCLVAFLAFKKSVVDPEVVSQAAFEGKILVTTIALVNGAFTGFCGHDMVHNFLCN